MDLDDIPQEPTLHDKVEAADIIWIAVPFSRKELLGPPAKKGLCFGLGALASDGVAWQELRSLGLGLPEKPAGFAKGKHYAFHQGPRPWVP